MLDLAGERSLVQPFHVPRYQRVETGVDEHFHEYDSIGDSALTNLIAHGRIRRDSGGNGHHTVAGEQPGDETDPADVRIAIFAREPEVFGQVGPDFVSVENL